MKKLTKKAMKENCNFQLYSGSNNQNNINAIFYDYQYNNEESNYFAGYKYMVKAKVRQISKKVLFDALYLWITTGKQMYTHYIIYKFAENDANRFKIPLSINMN